MNEANVVLPHLFRTEYRKIVSVLCRSFGLRDIELAEDIASETFFTAMQTWGVEGIPPGPTAWLYTVARHKAINHLKRVQTFSYDVVPAYQAKQEVHTPDPFESLGDRASALFFEDSQLRLMFALCHPAIAVEVQIALSLRLLCGFGISEIADAFLVPRETIIKRLLRGKQRLREVKVSMDLPAPGELEGRMNSVLTAIYLLFNEGYYASGGNGILRRDFCLEAVRLCAMLIEHPQLNRPNVNALMALMCFHFSRFDSRMANGEAVLYEEQDTSAWNTDWISRGGYFLHRSEGGNDVSNFHLEAAIAYHHTNNVPGKWSQILRLYDDLMQMNPTPVVAMNRAYALYKVTGAREALLALKNVVLQDNHLYHALLGLLWNDLDQNLARQHYKRAISLARATAVKRVLQAKHDAL